MTLYEFNTLDEQEKKETLINMGVFLTDRVGDGFFIKLYQVEGFYVETFRNIETNIIKGMRSFSSTEPLEPYLDKISINL